MPPLHHIREIHGLLEKLSAERASFKRASQLAQIAAEMFAPADTNTWTEFLDRTLQAWKTETGDSELPVQDALEFLYEACSEGRREVTYGEGVTLCTIHSAKGTEFDHVLVIGPWGLAPSRVTQEEEERRTFYVGLTRARETLAVFDRGDIRPSLPETLTGAGVIRYQFNAETRGQAEAGLSYKVLSLKDINLGYAGQFRAGDAVHKALSALTAGDKLTMRSMQGNGVGLFDSSNVCVARLSNKARTEWSLRLSTVREVRILAMVCRDADQDPEQTRRGHCEVSEWELPIVEIVSADTSAR